MKKALLIAALTVAATPAMASKARVEALSNAASVSDIQDVFANPAKATKHGEWLTLEMGATAADNAAASGTKAEGGFSRSMDAARWGFYMGHQYDFVTDTRSAINATAANPTIIAPDNSINLFYASNAGDMAWGLGLGYSKTDKKSTQQKQDMMALTAGVLMGDWEVAATLGLMNNYKDETATLVTETKEMKGKMALDLEAKYSMNDMIFSLGYGMNGAKLTDGTDADNTEHDISNWHLGVEKVMKAEGAHFFYGAQYMMSTDKEKVSGGKQEDSALPVYAGIEADAASWLVLRGSVSQNFILGQSDNGTAKDSVANNTTVAAGAGLKFGKLTIDGTLAAANAATANLDGGSMLAKGSLTYMF